MHRLKEQIRTDAEARKWVHGRNPSLVGTGSHNKYQKTPLKEIRVKQCQLICQNIAILDQRAWFSYFKSISGLPACMSICLVPIEAKTGSQFP